MTQEHRPGRQKRVSSNNNGIAGPRLVEDQAFGEGERRSPLRQGQTYKGEMTEDEKFRR